MNFCLRCPVLTLSPSTSVRHPWRSQPLSVILDDEVEKLINTARYTHKHASYPLILPTIGTGYVASGHPLALRAETGGKSDGQRGAIEYVNQVQYTSKEGRWESNWSIHGGGREDYALWTAHMRPILPILHPQPPPSSPLAVLTSCTWNTRGCASNHNASLISCAMITSTV